VEKKFCSLIDEKNNKFLQELKLCEGNDYQTFIYGAGEGANNVEKRAAVIGFKFAGKLVDKEYYKTADGVYCLEEILQKQKVNLVIAHRNFDKKRIEIFKDNIGILIDRDCFSGNYEADPVIMTFDFIKDHDAELMYVYDALADEKSKKVLVAYINQKISMDYSYLKKEKSDIQYFDPEIIDLIENEALVDAGAYTGDTALSFYKQLKAKSINKYKAIYSFEPDDENYKVLSELKLPNFITFKIATSDHKDMVGFSSVGKGSSSSIHLGNSKNTIKMDTLDAVLSDKNVTFIKMDVEGYELESLKGSQNIIQSQKPKLAICIYHKRTDLWEIQKYIDSIVSGYKFYIRAYEDTATELVLYALPD